MGALHLVHADPTLPADRTRARLRLAALDGTLLGETLDGAR
jgi:hypothetical protein